MGFNLTAFMNVLFSADFTGTPDAEDVIAARHAIFIENLLRANAVPPLPALPTGTPAQVKASYLTVLANKMNTFHALSFSDARSEEGLRRRFSAADLNAILANLITRLNAGETAATIVADTAA